MVSRSDAIELFDVALARLEGSSNLSELERIFKEIGEAFPFRSAAFSWWSYPPPARRPDYILATGADAPLAEVPVELSSDPWAVSLPVMKVEVIDGVDPLDVRVSVIGPRWRLGILSAVLLVGAQDMNAREYDWRGRLVLLAHVIQHQVGAWRGDERPALGRREIQCLKLAAEGLKAKQIASALGIGQQTVQFHLSRAREKLHCSNTVQAVARAAQFGLLPDVAPTTFPQV